MTTFAFYRRIVFPTADSVAGLIDNFSWTPRLMNNGGETLDAIEAVRGNEAVIVNEDTNAIVAHVFLEVAEEPQVQIVRKTRFFTYDNGEKVPFTGSAAEAQKEIA